jgi:TonB family protein
MKEFDAVQAPETSAATPSQVPAAEPPVAETLDLHDIPTEVKARVSESVSSGTERKSRGKRSLLRPLLAVLAVVVVGAIAWLMRPTDGGPPAAIASLTVETEPPGAEVWLDGRQAGFSPIELVELSPGIHAVRVSKEGYQTESEQVEIVGDESPPPLAFELVATAGFLSLESDPPEALVSIDGGEVGNSPVNNFVLEPGPHEIRVEKKGFLSWSMEVEAEVGESLNLVARLGEVPTVAAAPTAPPRPEPAPTEEAPPAEPEAPEVYELGPGITPPKKISGQSPTYPPMAKRMRQEGTVEVRMIVTEEGVPIELEVTGSASAILDEAVMKAVQEWRFEPAKKDGSPVRVYYTIRQTFRIGS